MFITYKIYFDTLYTVYHHHHYDDDNDSDCYSKTSLRRRHYSTLNELCLMPRCTSALYPYLLLNLLSLLFCPILLFFSYSCINYSCTLSSNHNRLYSQTLTYTHAHSHTRTHLNSHTDTHIHRQQLSLLKIRTHSRAHSSTTYCAVLEKLVRPFVESGVSRIKSHRTVQYSTTV